jgi:hypothetical protein
VQGRPDAREGTVPSAWGQNTQGKAQRTYDPRRLQQSPNRYRDSSWDTVPTGDVDAEIRMCKIWLARALELDHAISRDPTSQANRAGMTLSEIRQSSGDDGMARTDSITRRPDTIVRINMLLGRIAQLEKTRSELISVAKESDEGEAKPMPWVD